MRTLIWGLLLASAVLAGESSKPYYQLPGFRPAEAVLWHDPGRVQYRDLRYGPGGRALEPRPPFTFDKEDLSGTSPKVRVHDANGRLWVIKFGIEARPDTFSSRLAWVVGYYAEPNYYLEGEIIHGVHDLKRARKYIDAEGRASGGRFQLRAKFPVYMSGYSWAWQENPFAGTPQLAGLKVMMMLVSNWDDKDIRDDNEHGVTLRYHELLRAMKQGTNNAIYREGNRYVFFVDDWGASLGQWGAYMHRTKWDCAGFLNESRRFVRGVDEEGRVEWGFKGLHTEHLAARIRLSDVTWLLRYLGRVTDQQLRAGLLASGATEDEASCYTEALRMRIRQLEQVGAISRRAALPGGHAGFQAGISHLTSPHR